MRTVNRINQTIFFLVVCSASALLSVVYFQYILGLTPCKLCIWQRFPHILAVIMGLLILFKPQFRIGGVLVALISIFSGTLIAGYHTGIEAAFWRGPETCSGTSNLKDLSPELFLQKILATEPVRCDEIPWSFLKISMAGWNFIVSFLLTTIWASVLLINLKPFNSSKT